MHFGILIAGGDMLVQYVTQMFTILFSMHLVFCLSVRYDKYLLYFTAKRKLAIGIILCTIFFFFYFIVFPRSDFTKNVCTFSDVTINKTPN